jgi:hypothetical protein
LCIIFILVSDLFQFQYFVGEPYSGAMSGKVSWKNDESDENNDGGGHLHLNGQVGPRRGSSSSDEEAYDATLHLATPFPHVKNVSLNLGYANFGFFLQTQE